MTHQPDATWVEAARVAADRAYAALGAMPDIELVVTCVSQAEAAGTNSADSDFLDYLSRGGHLNANYLAGVK